MPPYQNDQVNNGPVAPEVALNIPNAPGVANQLAQRHWSGIENRGIHAFLGFVGKHPLDIPIVLSGASLLLLMSTGVSFPIAILACSAVTGLTFGAGLLVRNQEVGQGVGLTREQLPLIGIALQYIREHNNRVGPAPAEAIEPQEDQVEEVPPLHGANLNMVDETALDGLVPGADGDHSVDGDDRPPAGRASPRVTSGAAAALDPSNVRVGSQATL